MMKLATLLVSQLSPTHTQTHTNIHTLKRERKKGEILYIYYLS